MYTVKRAVRILLVAAPASLLLFTLLQACRTDKNKAAAGTFSADSIAAMADNTLYSLHPPAAEAMAGKQFFYIQSVKKATGHYVVTARPVKFLTGSIADSAAHAAGQAMPDTLPDGKVTYHAADGYYINDDKLPPLSLKLHDEAEVYVLQTSGDIKIVRADPDYLYEHMAEYEHFPFIAEVKDNDIVFLKTQYVP